MTKRGIGIVFVALGAVMLLGALLLTAMYEKREADAGHNAEMLMQEFGRSEATAIVPLLPPISDGESADGAAAQAAVPEMATADYQGLQMLGVIRVPSCGIELPVLDNWSMSTLEYAPCRYTGNIYSGDLVIMGHNYTAHFKPLKKIAPGAAVEFESVDGAVLHYTVDRIDSLHRNETEKLASEHELILFTCEKYGAYRFVARCSLVS